MKFTVYTKPDCPHCDQAKALIALRGHEYDEVVVDVGQKREDGRSYVTVQELKILIPTARTVPQVCGESGVVGGFAELKKLLG